MIHLDELQGHFATLIESIPAFRLNDEPRVYVVQNDGTYPKLAKLEEARSGVLAGKAPGIAVVVHFPKAMDTEETATRGDATVDVIVHVVVEETTGVARSEGNDAALTAPRMARTLIEWMAGRPLSTKPNHVVRLSSPPFEDFGVIDGLRRIVVNFECRCYLLPEWKG